VAFRQKRGKSKKPSPQNPPAENESANPKGTRRFQKENKKREGKGSPDRGRTFRRKRPDKTQNQTGGKIDSKTTRKSMEKHRLEEIRRGNTRKSRFGKTEAKPERNSQRGKASLTRQTGGKGGPVRGKSPERPREKKREPGKKGGEKGKKKNRKDRTANPKERRTVKV